jgi:hypothetical protein
VWINTDWLLWLGLRQHGVEDLAAELRASMLGLVRRSGFRELPRTVSRCHDGWTAWVRKEANERDDATRRRQMLPDGGCVMETIGMVNTPVRKGDHHAAAASLLVTAGPARRAARILPALAVRVDN